MSLSDLIKILEFALPVVLTAFATIVLLKERSRTQEKENDELKSDVKEFVKEFRGCISILNTTSERQAILQKITNDTLESVIDKIEKLEDRVFRNETKLAILEEKERSWQNKQ